MRIGSLCMHSGLNELQVSFQLPTSTLYSAAGCTGGHGRGRASNFSKAPPTSAYSGAGPAAPPGAGRGGPPYPAFAQSKVCAKFAHTSGAVWPMWGFHL
jgi:hypothetical protein